MKVAVAASGDSLDAQVNAAFARAPHFCIADTDTDERTFIPNTQNMNAAHGAGIQAGKSMVDNGVKAILAGHCGPRAFDVLSGAGIDIYVNVKGTVEQALEDLKAGKLQKAASADVGGHWA